MITIDDKEYRNLQEQVGYLTEELKKIKQSLGNALPDPIPGPQGEPGTTGGPGPQGRTPKIGFGFGPLPTDSSFENGDLYIIRATNNVYNLQKGNVYKKVNGVWELQLNIVGSQGPVGETGEVNVEANPLGETTGDLFSLDIDGVKWNILDVATRNYISAIKTYFGYSTVTEKYSFEKEVYINNKLEVNNGIKVTGNSIFYDYVTFQDSGVEFIDGATLVIDYLFNIIDRDNEPIVICENFNDKNGNARFVEGNITVDTQEGLNISYAKWSLSGSHLMIVIAGDVISGYNATLSLKTQINLPNYIRNKIHTLGLGDNISYSTLFKYDNTSASVGSDTAILIDASTYLGIYHSYAIEGGTSGCAFRIAFDLLIDMS